MQAFNVKALSPIVRDWSCMSSATPSQFLTLLFLFAPPRLQAFQLPLLLQFLLSQTLRHPLKSFSSLTPPMQAINRTQGREKRATTTQLRSAVSLPHLTCVVMSGHAGLSKCSTTILCNSTRSSGLPRTSPPTSLSIMEAQISATQSSGSNNATIRNYLALLELPLQ